MKRKNMQLNPVMIIIVSVICVVGMATGVALAKNNPDAIEIIKETEVFSGDYMKVFEKGLIINLLWTFLFAIGGLGVYFVPISLSAVFAKGYTYGFTTAVIVAAMGIKGYFIVTAGLFLHNFIFTIISVCFTAYSVNKSFECFVNRRNYDYKLRKNKVFFGATAIMLIVAVLVSVLEAALSVHFYEV